jgi:glutathione-regulated potassium-efflux system protein KefB
MAIALIVLKAGLLFGLALLFGVERRKALKLGLLLSQGGEFAFVLFAAAQGAALIAPEAATLFSAVVTMSMASTPFLMMLNDWMDRRRRDDDGAGLEGPETSPETRAIVVGFGRFGQVVAQMLMAKGISVTLIDSKPSQIELSGTFGLKVYYGDGTRLDLLRLAGAADAQALLFCLDGKWLNSHRLEPILEAFPQAAVFVRAFDRLHLMELAAADLKFVVREVFESAVLMGREALATFGIPPEELDRVEQEYRARDRERFEGQSRSGDLHALRERMFTPENALADEDGRD